MTDVPERRREPRRRSLLGASLEAGQGGSTLCLVRNLGSLGAKLAVSEAIPLPASFPIRIDKHGATRTAHLVWRAGDSVGVHLAPDPVVATVVPLHLAREVRALRAENDALRGRLAAADGNA